MATATREAKITITLAMNEEEAKYLRDVTENCLECEPALELTKVRELRESLFNAVDTGLKKRK